MNNALLVKLRRCVQHQFEDEISVKYKKDTSPLPVNYLFTRRFVIKPGALSENIGMVAIDLAHSLAAEIKRNYTANYRFSRPNVSCVKKADGWYIHAGLAVWEVL